MVFCILFVPSGARFKCLIMSYTVAQNATFLTGASILQRMISFVYFIFIARAIGVENTGQYFFAIAFTSIFASEDL